MAPEIMVGRTTTAGRQALDIGKTINTGRAVDSVKTGDPKHVLSDLQIYAFNTDLEQAMNF